MLEWDDKEKLRDPSKGMKMVHVDLCSLDFSEQRGWGNNPLSRIIKHPRLFGIKGGH